MLPSVPVVVKVLCDGSLEGDFKGDVFQGSTGDPAGGRTDHCVESTEMVPFKVIPVVDVSVDLECRMGFLDFRCLDIVEFPVDGFPVMESP